MPGGKLSSQDRRAKQTQRSGRALAIMFPFPRHTQSQTFVLQLPRATGLVQLAGIAQVAHPWLGRDRGYSTVRDYGSRPAWAKVLGKTWTRSRPGPGPLWCQLVSTARLPMPVTSSLSCHGNVLSGKNSLLQTQPSIADKDEGHRCSCRYPAPLRLPYCESGQTCQLEADDIENPKSLSLVRIPERKPAPARIPNRQDTI